MLTSLDVNVLQGREPNYRARCGGEQSSIQQEETGLGLGETSILTPPSRETAVSHQTVLLIPLPVYPRL